jgi:hypothetical protein
MNRSSFTSRLALALSTLTLAMLTACGGGSEAPVEVVAPNPQALPAAVPTLCGVQAVATSGVESFNVLANQTAELNGFATQVTVLTSPAGYSYAGATATMLVPMQDMREVLYHGYTELATPDRMGIEMGSLLAPGSVGCVAGVTRVADVGTAGAPNLLVSWASEQLPNLPVDRLPSQAINGFEFINNFADTRATAVFSMSKSLLVDAGSVQICHVGISGTVNCFTPSVTDSGQQWTFRLPISQPGVYMLSAPREILT